MVLTGSKMALWAPLSVWLVCGLITIRECATATDAADGYRKICPAAEHDIRENHFHQGAELSCCGHQAFHPSTTTCCKVGNEHNLTYGLSQMVSSCCGLQAYDSRNELCCESAVMVKSSPNATCCGKKAIDKNKEMCCGPSRTVLQKLSPHHKCCGEDRYNTMTEHCCQKNDALKICPISSRCCENESEPFDDNEKMPCGKNKKMVRKISPHHLCCGEDQYDPRTECCCEIDDDLVRCHISSSCCEKESGVRQQEPGSPPICTEPHASLCGSTCYNSNEFGCCDRHQTKSLLGQCDAVPTVYRPHTHVCCDGRVSEWNKGTEQPHGSLWQHCCGTEVYLPLTEICCNGHRQPKGANMHCCGTKAYNIKNKQMKCCAGTLYNLTQFGQLTHEVRCCGDVLQTTQDVCCISEEKELHYSAKTGFECCGHHYIDTSLWSCCAGRCTGHQPGHHHHMMVKGTRLQTLGHLNETKLCEQMLIGTVEGVSPKSILFGSVLKICGRNGTVRSLPSPYILETHDHCNLPKLSTGKTYLFDENYIYTNSYHFSPLQLLHFIFSKCNY